MLTECEKVIDICQGPVSFSAIAQCTGPIEWVVYGVLLVSVLYLAWLSMEF